MEEIYQLQIWGETTAGWFVAQPGQKRLRMGEMIVEGFSDLKEAERAIDACQTKTPNRKFRLIEFSNSGTKDITPPRLTTFEFDRKYRAVVQPVAQ